jgi:hypothetical protein
MLIYFSSLLSLARLSLICIHLHIHIQYINSRLQVNIMVTLDMNTDGDQHDSWTFSERDITSVSLHAPPYAAPNHFATSNYNARTSPITWSAAERRTTPTSTFSTYALPQPRTDVELQDFSRGTPAFTAPRDTTLPVAATRPTTATAMATRLYNLFKLDHRVPESPSHRLPMTCISFASALFMAALIVRFTDHSEPLHLYANWTRLGGTERMTGKQAMYASNSVQRMWWLFLLFLGFSALLMQIVYSYAMAAAVRPVRGGSDVMALMKPVFLATVLVLQGCLMWGWLLWT